MKRAALNRLRAWACALIDRLAAFAAGRPSINPGVLVVRLDAIGDFLLWLAAARPLAEHYRAQGRPVTLLANTAWAELARDLPFFDAVWPVDRLRVLQDPIYRFRLMRDLRRAGFDIAVQPTYSREALVGDAVVRAAGWHQRIGSSGDCSNQSPTDLARTASWYTDLIPADPAPMMEILRNSEFLTGLGITAPLRMEPLTASGPRDDSFVLFPGASWEGKCWPAPAFAQVAERIHDATGWTGIIVGGPGDRAQAQAVQAATKITLRNIAGTTTLRDLTATLARARLVITNDTSAAHLAANVGTPSVCILGGGHFGRFLPYPAIEGCEPPRVINHPMDCYGCNWRCCHPRQAGAPVACIADVTVDQVWAEVMRALPAPARDQSLDPY